MPTGDSSARIAVPIGRSATLCCRGPRGNLASGARFNRAVVQMNDRGIVARTIEVEPDGRQPAADVVYEFDASLTLRRASFSQRYWDVHAELERAGKLNHSRDRCPFRDGPAGLKEWEPSTGWRAIVGS